jgi:hypothetical protein
MDSVLDLGSDPSWLLQALKKWLCHVSNKLDTLLLIYNENFLPSQGLECS